MDGQVSNMIKNTIALIGAGQLGSRHLQGLLKIDRALIIEVVDPSEAALDLCIERAKEVDHGKYEKSISYFKYTSELSLKLDICIIATSAAVRFDILTEVLNTKLVKKIILEKILFQHLEHYSLAAMMLSSKGVDCWVNCPRRLFPVYRDIKSMIKDGEKLTFTAIGGDWGLACNAIHFIDLTSYLSNSTEFYYDTAGIEDMKPSKRRGYYELLGTLIGRKEKNVEFFLHSRNENTAAIKIQILSDRYFWQLDEGTGTLQTTSIGTVESVISNFKVSYQSELSNVICEDILTTGQCDLPGFELSRKLHQPLIESLLEVFNKRSQNKFNYCPIT